MYEMFDKKNIKSTKNLLIRIVSILAVRRLFFFFFSSYEFEFFACLGTIWRL